MTDRDRLVELISGLPFSAEYEKYNSLEFAEHLADYLLANGVIVPLVKVGDTLYKPSILGEITELKATGFDCEVITEPYNQIPLNTFGKTVFLTKEEAEQALAERSGDNA